VSNEIEAAEAAVADVLGFIFRQHPYTARRAGLPGFAARLPAVGPRSLPDIDRRRATVLGHLATLADRATPELRADLHAAAKFLDVERFEVEQLGMA